ncbi:MAG TPA: nucleotide sugar dehydrogenase [Candidatus Micrarchaeia archaeon]|nr:nucleotide sugar dehydrogenase [Candidatus Micrarchaeia archaeon]
MMWAQDVVVVGGCGHVGLPLALALADRGARVTAYDHDARAVAGVLAGRMPFLEHGAEPVLARVLAARRLTATTDPAAVAAAEHVVVVVGTPIDEHLNPETMALPHAIEALAPHLRAGQLLILRSTVYPGVTRLVERRLEELGLALDLAFCPERIAEGRALAELCSLPQIVASRTATGRERAARLFRQLTSTIVELEPEEAELAKLFTNTWRYVKFATANQLYMIANDFGLDYERIRRAAASDYPRAADLPGAGFTAGPCLLKDTMQLAAFNNNQFALGQASMLVNEGLPLYLVARLERRFELSRLTVGILGMAFKAESDDTRASLSYKLRRILAFKARSVVCTDPHVSTDPSLLPLETVLARADLLVIGAPHAAYRGLRTERPVVDVTDLLGRGVLV